MCEGERERGAGEEGGVVVLWLWFYVFNEYVFFPFLMAYAFIFHFYFYGLSFWAHFLKKLFLFFVWRM